MGGVVTDEDMNFCLDLAKQLSTYCTTEKGVHMAKLHVLLGFFNYSINYATINNVSEEKIKKILNDGDGS